jgi:hypothetical protein
MKNLMVPAKMARERTFTPFSQRPAVLAKRQNHLVHEQLEAIDELGVAQRRSRGQLGANCFCPTTDDRSAMSGEKVVHHFRFRAFMRLPRRSQVASLRDRS